jgi:hypothetical protein
MPAIAVKRTSCNSTVLQRCGDLPGFSVQAPIPISLAIIDAPDQSCTDGPVFFPSSRLYEP